MQASPCIDPAQDLTERDGIGPVGKSPAAQTLLETEPAMAIQPRKMIALDHEDLQVLSAHCQDAVIKVSDIHYFASEKRLIIEMNRFLWENGTRQNIRVRSVLHFERVNKVARQAIDPAKKNDVLSLLAILFAPTDAPAGHIDLVFSGEAVLRLAVECVEGQLTDLKAAWEASSKPSHPSV